MSDEFFEKAIATMAVMLGPKQAEAMRAMAESGDFAADLARLGVEFAFGSIWSREGLSPRERSLVTLGALIALRQTDEVRNHVRIGMRNGLTPEQIREVLAQAMPYAGLPAVAQAMEAAISVLREQGVESAGESARDRGLL